MQLLREKGGQMSEICNSCKAYLMQRIGQHRGHMTNLCAYGCKTLQEEGKYCDRNALIKYLMMELDHWNRYPDIKPDKPHSAFEAKDYLVVVEMMFDGELKYGQEVYKYFAKDGFYEDKHPNKQRWIKVIYWRELVPMPKEIKQ